MNESIKLTIAVPVYNVSKYLNRCLNSLIDQQYDSKEILIINDGSTDDSLEICKNYEEKYSYIRVINQENKGLAYVRNRCIQEAKGEYISFIDSDDFVLPDLYQNCMDIIEKNNVDILCYGVENIYDDEVDLDNVKNSVVNKEEKIRFFSKEMALDEMFLPNNIDVITCNKIIKKQLYSGILYPVGKYYEDMYTNYKVIANANIICSTSNKYYVYCHRGSSIGGMKFNENTMDLFKAATEVYEYSLENGLKPSINLKVGYIQWLIVVLNMMIRSNHYDHEYLNMVQSIIKDSKKEIKRNTYIGKVRKFQMLLLAYSYKVYVYIYMKYLKRHRNYEE